MVRKAEDSTSEAGPKTLLSLTTRSRRDVVRIDGVAYDMATLGSLSLNERQDLGQAIARMRKLERQSKRSADDEREYSQRIREVCELALPKAPASVIAKLPRDRQEVLAGTFFALLVERSGRGQAFDQYLRARSGLTKSRRASSSRGSRRSTAAIPVPG